MSRKSNSSDSALVGMAAQALTIDTSGRRHSSRTTHHNNKHSSNNHAESVLHSPTTTRSSGSTSLNNASTADSAIGDLDGDASTDSDNADEEDGEDDDQEAVMAPSDHAIHAQAGRNILRGDNVKDALLLIKSKNHNKSILEGFSDHKRISKASHAVVTSEDDEDDNIYNNVDLISESDGEDPDIEQTEEANIINEFLGDKSLGNDLDDLNLFAENSLFPGDVPYFDEQIRQISYSRRVEDLRSYSPTDAFPQPLPSPPPPTPTVATRRVRFDSSAVVKSPCFALNEKDVFFSSGQPFDEDSDGSSIGLSGYDSDGETTDEDEVPLTATKSPRDLLHQPSWSEEPLASANSASPNAEVRAPRLKIRCGPRLASWIVDAGKSLGQSDQNREVVVLEPLCRPATRPGDPQITACLSKHIVPRAPKQRSPIKAPIKNQQPVLPDPTLGSDTTAAMAGLMENITGEDGNPQSSQSLPSDFLPADDVFDELNFTAANSDHESTDLDIMDFIEFDDDSSDSANQAKCLKLTSKGDEQEIQSTEYSKEVFTPLLTPKASQSQPPSPLSSSAESVPKGLESKSSSPFRRGIPPSQTRPPLRRPRSGLALTKPTSRSGSGHVSNTPPKFERKRKLSDSYTSSSHRPNTRLRR